MIAASRLQDIVQQATRHAAQIDAQIARRLAAVLGSLRREEILPAFEPWLAEAHRVLLDSGWAEQGGDQVAILKVPLSAEELAGLWQQEEQQWLADPNVCASVQLVNRCLTALPDILTGRCTAPAVIFPGATLALVEGIYKNNPLADFFNDALGETCVRVLRARLQRHPRTRIRILEVGAGTGGTTAALLQQLAPFREHIEEYLYTDVSQSFLAHAEENYAAAHPFLRTRLFNVELPAAGQGLAPASFDFVIAANVLHATRNVARTLRNLKYTLRTNGVLLLNELTRKSLVTHVTFGLLDGWWLVEDGEIRNAGSPSLTVERWRAVLLQEGYRSIVTPVSEVEAALGQQIIAAESDGVVRLSSAPSDRADESAMHASGAAAACKPPAVAADDAAQVSAAPPSLQAAAIDYVLDVLSQGLKLERELLDPSEQLGNYGVDSILIGQLTHRLQGDFARITTTLFFEKNTAEQLAAHLAASYPAELQGVLDRRAGGRKLILQREAACQPQAANTPAGEYHREHRAQRIAIVGLSGSYPRAPSVQEFWQNLKAGEDCITEIPAERWPLEGFYEPDPDAAVAAGRSYSKWGGFLDNVRGFDAQFFNISPREAVGMDPQERLFLTCCWELLEDAGYTRSVLAEQYHSQVGVFVGITRTGFELFGPALWAQGERLYPRTSFSGAANRVSYCFDLHGPSLAIDTMCSSSLVAVHEACLHLREGTCRLAIAGGVNVYLHPSSYVGLSAARMLSKDGRCHSFGAEANGFVPGEGVGAVLLRPLEDAVAQGDRIHAVITGSSVNHGGKTNGFTVPNPNAHASLIRQALQQAGVQARQIGYLESHGTGTDLGDPIEIAGLSAAFREDTPDTGYCRIGSVKSNIGHLEAAAGIAGLTKIILQLKEGLFIASLNAAQLNPNVRFEESPFVVQRRLETWEAARRIAGISSFGAGGANAHVIVEEYVAEPQREPRTAALNAPFAVVLSARTVPQLRQMATNLRRHLQAAQAQCPAESAESYLCDLAYTLQVGREALEERLGLVVASIDELQQGLAAYVDGDVAEPLGYCGRIKRAAQRQGTFASAEELELAIDGWIAARDYAPLLEAWVRGVPIAWRKLYPPARLPQRIALPTYPFASSECWFGAGPDAADRQAVAVRGSESFLSDHLVQGRKTLPAVMYLELVRAQVQRVLGAGSDAAIEIGNVVWPVPIEVDAGGKTIHIALSAPAGGSVHWEFHTVASSGQRIVHAQGLAQSTHRPQPCLDVAALKAQMTRGTIAGEQCYQAFARLNIEYGATHRGIRRIEAGDGQLLAEIDLSATGPLPDGSYVLPPGVMDSALQSCIGLDAGISAGSVDFSRLRSAVPFALRQVSIYAPCAPRMLAWVRLAGEQGVNVRKLDIDVCDWQGRVAVQLRGYATRNTGGSALPQADAGAALLHHRWLPAAAATVAQASIAADDTHVVLCGGDDCFDVQVLAAHLQNVHGLSLPAQSEQIAEWFTAGSVQLLQLVQRLRGSAQRPLLLQVVVPEEAGHHLLLSLSPLLWTAALEGRGMLGQMIVVSPGQTAAALARQLILARATPNVRWLRLHADQWFHLQWERVPRSVPLAAPWRHDGVYLITGGCGRVAQAVAAEILRLCPAARIIGCGRTAVPAGMDAGLQYRQADVTRLPEVQSLVDSIVAEHSALHGVIHAAGVHQDRWLENKTAAQWRAVLAPKVAGAVNLDLATAALPLDFLALWSSGAAVFGHAAQADYATANAFLDQFAHWRNERVRSGQRTGRTLSLNWPEWAVGGMALSAAARDRLTEQFELRPLTTAAALDAFYSGLQTELSQVLVASGHVDRILRMLNDDSASAAAPASKPAAASEADAQRVRAVLRQAIATILHLQLQDIHDDAEFGELGFDSVLLTELSQSLNRELSLNLDPTVFFDHLVLEDFAKHLVSEIHGSRPVPASMQPESAMPVQQQPLPQPVSPSPLLPVSQHSLRVQEAVAVIGMSGEFPQAPNIQAFWENLAGGRDCIGEIPAERWSWQALFGDPQLEPHKTNVKWGGFIEGAAGFDPLFFSISPREAELMDPQQRLLMTHVYWAIEEAGYDPDSLAGSNTGIFVGTGNSGYGALAGKAGYPVNAYSATSVIPSVGPNRMSFFLDLHGPSMPVETACSSALVAIHEAVSAIRSGRCDAAIAGGVMTIVTPDGHISFSQAGMLSMDGRCKAFSAQADGYVRGEGVGMLMLKPLSAALGEGAHIHGLIRGSGVNHGGRANSLTAPNPKAQAALLQMTYADAGIDPRTVSYIETHGTGTALGDPIEINALKAAFKSLYAQHEAASVTAPQCGLGSVKSNIGHLEMAAGVAGVIKVLLQFKHRQVVATLHCEQPNPYIDLAATPFYLVTANAPWVRPVDLQGEELPRRAGVSSFGFGGVNAHLVLEEFIAQEEAAGTWTAEPELVLLSARTPEQLQEAARNLLAALAGINETQPSEPAARAEHLLQDVAFTLQMGRAALDRRLAIVAGSLAELQARLRTFIEGTGGAGDTYIYVSSASADPEALAPFYEDEELQAAVQGWLRRRKLARLAALWVRGAKLDWRKLHAGQDRRPRRLSLPGYPFAMERYWIAGAARINSLLPPAVDSAVAAAANPFSHVNTSDLRGLRFTVTFSAADALVRDHVVRGQPTLPGVVYLEMIRAAYAAAADGGAVNGHVQLRNVVWTRQLVVAESRKVHVRLWPQSAAVRCEVTSALAGSSESHAQCLVQTVPAVEEQTIDLESLQARLAGEVIDGASCYERFATLGLNYGTSHRAIVSLRRGKDEALAELRLLAVATSDAERFILHPGMTDAALQAAIGVSADDASTWVPFSVERITVLGACTERMWAWVRRTAASGVLDIDLCDAQGKLCLAVRRMTCKAIAESETQSTTAAGGSITHSCQFTGREYFVVDHMNVVPGVVLLEKVRAAALHDAAQASGEAELTAVEFTHVVWPQPAVVRGPLDLQMSFRRTADQLEFSVSSAASTARLHAQGRLGLHSAIQQSPPALDLAALQARCSRTLNASAIKHLLRDAPHGPSMMPLEHLQLGADEALGKLQLPAGAEPLPQSLAVHPSMMHGVLLVATLFVLQDGSDAQVELPFSLESMRLLAPLPAVAYVHVCRDASSARKLALQVADAAGRICACIDGFTTVALHGAAGATDHALASLPRSATLHAATSPATSQLLAELVETVAALAKLSSEKIDVAVELSKYGMDSLGLTELTNTLNRRYGLSLMPTIFFEHATLASLANYLSAHHGEILQRAAGTAAVFHPEPLLAEGTQPGMVTAEPMAVVGMSARLPGAQDLRQFWQHLQANADLIVPIPRSRWQQAVASPAYASAAGFMLEADCFDSLFFSISPREAEAMDPQQRLFLETVWACMEDAGYASSELSGSSTGVFVGASTSDYRDLCLVQAAPADSAGGATFRFEIANRVSYTLNLRGPSEVIDTACSSSLVALHRAIESIRAGDCTAAFAGGVNLIANPRLMMDMSRAGMLSSDGRCKTFDRRADGYGRGEGVGAVLIKPLGTARAAGDHIYGLIRASAVNHGGRATSPTAPNAVAQADLLFAAYAEAGIAPSSVSYIETHGTGTQLGDPVEVNALKEAFARLYTAFGERPAGIPHCALGSVKTNIGHLEAAAGISALIKVLLMLQHRRIPGNPHLLETNPYVRLEGSPFFLAKQTANWPGVPGPKGALRRAGVSSFGVGGSNAHVVLDEYPEDEPLGVLPQIAAGPLLIPLSARDPERLRAYAHSLRQFLQDGATAAALQDIAWTLQTGRDALACRVAFVVQSQEELLQRLHCYVNGSMDIQGCWQGRADAMAVPPGIQEHAQVRVLEAPPVEVFAKRYVRGESVDWGQLYGGPVPRRVSLPSYPFARIRHWLPAASMMQQDKDAAAAAMPEVVMAVPLWQPLAEQPAGVAAQADFDRWILLCDIGSSDAQQIEQAIAASHCLCIESQETDSSARYSSVALRLFEVVQDILRHRLSAKRSVLLQVVAMEDEQSPGCAAVTALLKSAHQENPALFGQFVSVSPQDDAATVARKLELARATAHEPIVRYGGAVPQVLRWSELPAQQCTAPVPWKPDGVYLITGGMGGLGKILARDILQQAPAAVVILAGRSELDPVRNNELLELQSLGTASYEQVDVCEASQVQALIQRIVSRHGRLQGVVHAAGLHRDGFILKKNAAEFASVLAPKVAGTVHLDDATRQLDLDCFILFSSGSGAAGNAGQSDYAAANAFMDEYAHYRHGLVSKGERRGRTLSLDWSLWAEGGMQIGTAQRDWLKQHLGIVPLDTAAALQAFYSSLLAGQPQVMVVGGQRAEIRAHVLGIAAQADQAEATVASEVTAQQDAAARPTVDLLLVQLQAAVADLLKLPPSALGFDAPLDEFGLDSMMVTRLTQRLHAEIGDIPRILFYEHRTLRQIATHLAGRDAQLPRHRLESLAVAAPAASAIRAPIAIIGMSGRYAAAADLQAFWEKLLGGQSCITEIPAARWPLEDFYHPSPQQAVQLGRSYGKWGGFLEDFAAFDPLFFNIAAKDAAVISPQERLFLEEAWKALEDAAYRPSRFDDQQRQRIGVYGAVTKSQANTSFAALVNRVSYFMNFHGPSMPVDTKCSSALVALHQACEALQRREIDLALVGAVNLYLEPATYLELAQTGLLADAPRAALFSAQGSGFVPSEGVGAMVLKRLDDAERSHDGILALVRGTAVNHSGRTLNFGVPDPQQQAAAIRRAWQSAEIDPQSISYIESSANGSEVGDAVEIAALAQAFAGSLPQRAAPVRIGSLKSTVGHAEAASAMAQLSKVVLQLRHRMLCPTVLPAADAQGRTIVTDTGGFELQRSACPWDSEAPLRAAVHSVGAGGVNAHAVIEEYVAASPPPAPAWQAAAVFVVSAKTQTALSAYLQHWQRYLTGQQNIDLYRLAYTVQRGREAMRYRFAAAVHGIAELIAVIEAAVHGKPDARYRMSNPAEAAAAAMPSDALPPIAARWLAGEEVDWDGLYQHAVPRVLNGLPTYPFSRKTYWRTAATQPAVAETTLAATDSTEPVPEEAARPEPAEDEPASADALATQQSVRAVINRLLEFTAEEEISVEDNFTEMGFDSVSIVRFVESLNECFAVALEVTAPFNYPSIRTLAAYIDERTRHAGKSPAADVDGILTKLAQNDAMGVEEALSLLDQLA